MTTEHGSRQQKVLDILSDGKERTCYQIATIMYGNGEMMHGKTSNILHSLYVQGFVDYRQVDGKRQVKRYWRIKA